MAKRVLITGGGASIGRAIAEQCQRDGYETVILDRKSGDITVDLASEEETSQALNEALEGGPILRLVNNVGIVNPGPISEVASADLRSVVEVNIRCAIQCVQALLPGMRQQGFGRIVSISSRANLGKANRTVYSATKAAVVGMSRTWALELGQASVTSNVISPGPIETPLFREVNPPELAGPIIDAIPVGRIGTPEDIANAASFLLNEKSGYVTGQNLYVCGGMSVGSSGI